jgi:hypothetical protein
VAVLSAVYGERTVPVVLEVVAFGASRRERQDGIETTQGLNGGLLIKVGERLNRRRTAVAAIRKTFSRLLESEVLARKRIM